MKNVIIYVHGKGGNAEESNYYRKFFNDDFDIIGFDYKSENPWDAKSEFNISYCRYGKIDYRYDDLGKCIRRRT